jgi:small subunit ribosomal protein S6
MRFDASARAQHTLRKTWASDPRLLRFSVVKMGNTLEEICDVGGKAEEWAHALGKEGSTGISDVEAREGAVSAAIRDLTESRTMGGGKFRFSN